MDDLEAMLAHFYSLMDRRVTEKHEKGYTGWDDDNYYDLMWAKLHKHVKLAEEGRVESYIDIANLAAFLRNLKVAP